METLKFSYNWNGKLNCNYYSTIRISNRLYVGECVEVKLKGKFLHNAKVVAKRTFYLNDLTAEMALLDTGYSREATISILTKMYPLVNQNSSPFFYHVLEVLKKEESKPIQTEMTL